MKIRHEEEDSVDKRREIGGGRQEEGDRRRRIGGGRQEEEERKFLQRHLVRGNWDS